MSGSQPPANNEQSYSLETEASYLISAKTISLEKEQNQVILPLNYQNTMMGLLVTRRQAPKWTQKELLQLDKIAETLAIACFLDQRQIWYQQKLQEQYTKQNLQRDLLDHLLHQLRNPLTALRTFGKLLLKGLSVEDKRESFVKGIIRETEHIQELLVNFEQEFENKPSEILDNTVGEPLNLPDATTAPLLLPSAQLSLEPIQLAEILEPLMINAQAIAQEKNLKLVTELPRDLPTVKAHPSALVEVLSNLIDNAIKYTASNGQIQINLIPDSEKIGIEIVDNGCGIPLADQAHIFEKNYRGIQAQGEIPGTGLGLTIVKKLVEQMKGSIEVESPVFQNHGTKFTIWLPKN